MKYGVVAETLLERLALLAGQVPVPAFDTLFGLMKARTLMAGVRLGVFDALDAGPRTPAEVAGACGLDAGCTELLLRTLVFSGYLAQRGERFALSRLGRRYLTGAGSRDLRGFVEWSYTQWELIEHLEGLLQGGRGVRFHEVMTEPARWAAYQRAMLEIARFDAPIVARRVPVRPGARKLLDAAGSHGLLGAAICRRHPPMRSTVIDLPAALPHARRLAAQEGLDGLVEHLEGDVRSADFGAANDVVLFSNILHHFDSGQIAATLGRARAALAPSGTVAIWEIERPAARGRAGLGDGAALFFRLASDAACYRGEEYAAWLKAAGFERVRVSRPMAGSPGGVLVTGRA